MKKFLVTTDSGCDLSEQVCNERGIYVLLLKYTRDGEVCTDTMRLEERIAFFEQMAQGALMQTSAANVSDYLDFWTALLPQGLPIVHISLGSGISSSYQNAMLAREQLLFDHPNASVFVIDSLGASLSYGMLALRAADMRDNGLSAEDCAAWLQEHRNCANPYYTTGDLEYLYRGGRVSRAGFVIARALNIWPILNLNGAGELRVVEKCRGKKRTYDRIRDIIAADVVDPHSQTLYVCHSNAFEEAKVFAEQVRDALGFKDIFYTCIGASIGAHAGPGLVALFYYGHPRTDRT